MCFRRLAIVGGANGLHPFINAYNRVVVSVNGEIYNHKQPRKKMLYDVQFTTHSDCEVVLHRYKRYDLSFINYLRGMYSIVIYDAVKRIGCLIRDRFGVKPMYYSQQQDTLYFSTEIKPLMRISTLNVRFALE